MSCTLAAPPGAVATTAAISAGLSATSGSICGVIASQPSGIRFGGTSTQPLPSPTAAARSFSVGVANKVRTSACSPARRIRSSTRTAISECPPSSKKLSCRPTRSIPSTSPQIAASASSIAPSGAS